MVTSVGMADGSLTDLNDCRLRVSAPSGARRADQRALPRTGALTETSLYRRTVQYACNVVVHNLAQKVEKPTGVKRFLLMLHAHLKQRQGSGRAGQARYWIT